MLRRVGREAKRDAVSGRVGRACYTAKVSNAAKKKTSKAKKRAGGREASRPSTAIGAREKKASKTVYKPRYTFEDWEALG